MGTQHIIELNGRRYDALTGKLLPLTEVPAHKAKPAHAPVHSMDGFVKPKSHAPRKVAATAVAPHAAAKSSTLMRKAVKKPAPLTKPTASPASTPIAKSQYTPPADRLDRAEHTKRSSLIQRFGSEIAAGLPATKHHATKAAHIAVAAVSMPIAADVPEQTNSVLENALSHQQPKLKKTPVHHRVARKMHVKPRTLSVSAAVMAFVVLGGFFAFNNAPNLSMRVAAMKSEVHGTLPGYKPAGFALNGPIKYQPGEIVVSYKSNSDSRNFQITQRASSWDTDSLRENFVASLNTNYQTVQDKGKTIYLYGDSGATWVDAGVWYNISGNSQLNTDQVLKLASSL